MPQSNVIFFYLFAAFFVFITMRGELPVYLGFLLSPASGTKGPDVVRGPDLPNLTPTRGSANGTSVSDATTFIGDVAKIAAAFA